MIEGTFRGVLLVAVMYLLLTLGTAVTTLLPL